MKKYALLLVVGVLSVFVSISVAHGGDFRYGYDQDGRLILVVDADGTTIEYSYDEVGNRMTRIVSGGSDLQARFSAAPVSGPAPLAVAFSDPSTGAVTSWSWSFGDGSSSTSASPSHTYQSAAS